MNILVTGAKGFVGRNLCENLKNIRDGKDKTRAFSVENVFEYDIDSGNTKYIATGTYYQANGAEFTKVTNNN